MTGRDGGCLCGSVRYSIDVEPDLVGVCHCRDCQRFTGSAFSFLVVVPDTAFKLEGATKTYESQGDSGGQIARRFCPQCGSSISEEAMIRPGKVLINGGTLDDPGSLTPQIQVYCDRGLGWAQLDEDIQRFATAPPD
jgi:hypothetical protein